MNIPKFGINNFFFLKNTQQNIQNASIIFKRMCALLCSTRLYENLNKYSKNIKVYNNSKKKTLFLRSGVPQQNGKEL